LSDRFLTQATFLEISVPSIDVYTIGRHETDDACGYVLYDSSPIQR